MIKKFSPDSPFKPWLVCLGAALFFYFVFFQLAMFNSISHDVMQDFGLHTTKLGYLSSSYFFADAIAIIPAGILLGRFSTRFIVLSVMAICVLTTFAFAFTHSFSVALLSRIVNGAGNAFAFLSSMQLAARWLPAKRLALGISLIITIFMTGGLIAQAPLMLLITHLGWRWAVIINAFIGVLFWWYIFCYLEDYPLGAKPTTPIPLSINAILTHFKIALKNKQNWLCSFYITSMNFPIIILGELWGIMYLMQTKALTLTSAGNVTSMLFIGSIIGSPLSGWLSDQWQRRVQPMFIGSILLLLMILFIMFNNHLSVMALSFCFFILGLLSSLQAIGYPTVAESNPESTISTAMSIVAILFNFISFLIQPLFGWLIHIGWHGEILNNTPVYSPADFHRAMWLLPIACLISIVVAYKTRETYARQRPVN